MENSVATIENELLFDPKNLTKETIKKYLCPLASDQELTMGLQIAKTYGLNPLKRELYFVKYKADQPMQVLTGYEVYLKRAERSEKWNGMEVSSEGKVEDGSLKAIVKIYRKDWDHPLIHEAFYIEYVQKKLDGTINTFWKNKPITMIKKVAVSQALRLTFPDEFDGMPYTSDEVIDQEKVIDVKIEEPLKMPTAKVTLPPIEEVVIQKDSIEIAKEVFNGTIVDKPIEYIDSKAQETIKSTAKQKGFTAKTFKEWLMYNFEIESISKIPCEALGLVTKKMQTLKDVK